MKTSFLNLVKQKTPAKMVSLGHTFDGDSYNTNDSWLVQLFLFVQFLLLINCYQSKGD